MLNDKIINFQQWLKEQFNKYAAREAYIQTLQNYGLQCVINSNKEEYTKWLDQVIIDELTQEFKKDLKDYLEKNNLL